MPETSLPHYIHEAETLLDTQFHLEGEPATLNEDTLHEFIYLACLRMVASYRRSHPQEAQSPETKQERVEANQAYIQSNLAEIALNNCGELRQFSRQLRIAQKAEQLAREYEEREELNEREEYVKDILDSLSKPPEQMRVYDDEGKRIEASVHGAIAVAPTGFGKTGIMAETVKQLGIGKPLSSSKPDDKPLRALLVTPTQVLVDQIMDPEETFRTYGPQNISMSRFYQYEKNLDSDIVVTTNESFTNAISEEQLKDFDIILIDEVHHITGPQFLQSLVDKKWKGTTLGFSATPGYDAGKDARNVIPNTIEHYDMLRSINAGILNGGELYTFSLNPQQCRRILKEQGILLDELDKREIIRNAIDSYIIEFLRPLLAEGRRGMVFCEAGEKVAHAKKLAEHLSLLEINGRNVCAKAVSTYDPESLAILEQYKSGKDIDVLTTTNMALEGFNAEVDFVIVRNTQSELQLMQMVGRGTRVNENFPYTVYAQFLGPSSDNQEKVLALHRLFGLTHVEQGYQLGKIDTAPSAPSTSESRFRAPLSPLLLELAEQIDGVELSKVYVGVERGKWRVPEGHTPINTLIDGYATSSSHARERLKQAGFNWKGEYVKDEEGDYRLVHYFPDEAADFMAETFAKKGATPVAELAEQWGVSFPTIKRFAAEVGISPKTMLTENAKSADSVNPEDLPALETRLAQIPTADPHAITFPKLAKELGTDKDAIIPLAKSKGITADWRHSDKGLLLCITGEEAESIRHEYNNVPKAGPGDMTLAQIASEADVTHKTATSALTEVDLALTTIKRAKDTRGRQLQLRVWEEAAAQTLVERLKKLKPRPLPPHLVPTTSMRHLISKIEEKGMETIETEMHDIGEEFEEITLTGSRQATKHVSWNVIRYFQEELGPRKGSPELDFTLLPSDEAENDPVKSAYAQFIQMQLLPAQKIGLKHSKEVPRKMEAWLLHQIKGRYEKTTHQKKMLESINILLGNGALTMSSLTEDIPHSPARSQMIKFREGIQRTGNYDSDTNRYIHPTSELWQVVPPQEVPAIMHFFGMDRIIYGRQLPSREAFSLLNLPPGSDIASYVSELFERIKTQLYSQLPTEPE